MLLTIGDMAVTPAPQSPSRRFEAQFRIGTRTVHLGSVATGLLIVASAAACLFSAISCLFIGFHDQLVTSMVAQQSDQQSNYEDQIALLRRDKELALSRELLDHHTLSTVVQNLVERAAVLESRADSLARMGAGSDAGGRMDAADPARRAALGTGSAQRADAGLEQLSGRLARVAQQQEDAVARLGKPAAEQAQRYRRALAEVGLTPSRFAVGDTGGPFEPLPEQPKADAFERHMADVKQALDDEANLSRLVDRVPLHLPLGGSLEVSSPFGARTDPFYGKAAFHTGIDLRQTVGDAVFATAAGTVSVAGPSGGYGDMVEVDHGHGLSTRYAHLSFIDVVVGQHVDVHSVVGRVGSTGRSTGPHLHYETRIDGEPVDPERFLRAALRLAN